MLYRASRDGFSAESFHSKCDNIPKTLTIIKVKDEPNIFGGYTEATWDGKGVFKKDRNAFLFSLINEDNKPVKMKINNNVENAIYCDSKLGPTFGGGKDFCICSNSNTNKESFSNLGYTYQHPKYHFILKKNINTIKAMKFLAVPRLILFCSNLNGDWFFLVSEIEVYTEIIKDTL